MSKETRQVLQLIELAKEMFYDGNAMTLSQKKTAWRNERALSRRAVKERIPAEAEKKTNGRNGDLWRR